jgi:hypothetical protein
LSTRCAFSVHTLSVHRSAAAFALRACSNKKSGVHAGDDGGRATRGLRGSERQYRATKQ